MRIRETSARLYSESDNRRKLSAKRRGDIMGIAACAAMALAVAGGLYGMARIDAANGISVSQSLANHGIGRASPYDRFERPDAARPARLIGSCGGQIMAAEEESSFPAGCAWIEPIRLNGESGT